MIRYALKCPADHVFESWFRSAGAFDDLLRAGQVVCPDCGSAEVEKALMAPTVAGHGGGEHPLARLRRRIERESDYVGRDFPAEARAIHDGEAPDRPIWGEARPVDALGLLRDGIAVAPLPLPPRSKMN